MKAVYIHIPFCTNICSYCDFCKVYYDEQLVDRYLTWLAKEIDLNYKNELIETIYIGGGTPTSLTIDQLKELFIIINKFNLTNNIEFTIECNPENTTIEKLTMFKNNRVNRLSIGVQTFNEKYLRLLNRNHNNKQVIELINDARALGFNNINVDLIYGIPNQTFDELKEDIDQLLSLNVPHISTYSFILEEHTKLYIDKYENIDPELEYRMYEYIRNTFKKRQYVHYEISNFAKENYESKHNLNYWHNNHYYGFGLGAHGYIDNIRYENTRSINKYCNGQFLYKMDVLSLEDKMEYETILGLRKIKGVNKKTFKQKYKKNIYDVFDIIPLIDRHDIIDDNEYIYIPIEKLYISNDILINFIK